MKYQVYQSFLAFNEPCETILKQPAVIEISNCSDVYVPSYKVTGDSIEEILEKSINNILAVMALVESSNNRTSLEQELEILKKKVKIS